MRRLILIVVALTVAETAWALFAEATGVNLFVFYAVLVLASALFWAPGLLQKKRTSG
jgi:hypothetical protein